MRSLLWVIVVGGILMLSSLTGCHQSRDSARLPVIVSILPQAEFVEAIGGELVEVHVMIPPGGSPATYEPTPTQLRDLSKARIYVRIGHIPFEKAWMGKILRACPDIKVVDSSEGIEIIDSDPHIWNSPRLVKKQVETICRGLVEVDSAHQTQYERNKERYLAELDVLDKDIAGLFEGTKQRTFMVFHPVWTYFARNYGLEQIAIEEEGKEPSAVDIARLIEIGRQKGITAVFVQPQFNERQAAVVAEQIGAKLVKLDPLAPAYRENMRHVAQTMAQELAQTGN